MEHTTGMSLETPAVGLHLIRVRGELDESAGARLLRLIDARLQINGLGLRPGRTRHILIDLSAVTSASRAGLAALSHARHTTQRRRVGLALIGAGALTCRPGDTGAHARAALRTLACYPDTTAAITALQHPPHPGHAGSNRAAQAPAPASTGAASTALSGTALSGTAASSTGADE